MLAFVRVVSAAMLFAAFCATAFAQDAYPARPVHIFVPYPPGGAVDIVARTLGDALGKALESIGRHREPAGRRRHRRRAGFGASAAGRLHADPRRLRPRAVAAFLRQAALRHVQGFYPDLADRLLAQHAFGARRFAVQIGGRCHRRRPRQARRAVLRPCRQRHLTLSLRRIVQIHGEGRDHPGAV